MTPLAIVAAAAESALGSGDAAFDVPPVGHPATTRITSDTELTAAGAKRPFMARAALEVPPGLDRARVLLERTVRHLARQLDVSVPDWRTLRVGLALGTSSGGMLSLTQALTGIAEGRLPDAQLARAAPYFGPTLSVADWLGVGLVERCQVLAACASSGIAAGIAARWLEAGHADLVVAGGYDAVGLLVAAGFECLHATSATRPAPFRIGRDGMALGEGAALWALATPDRAPRPLGYLRGFGASADAVHVTAPDREGRGLVRAMRAAIADAALSPGDVDLVSAHATATPYNDAAEARAMATVFGQHTEDIVVLPYKAVVGHTLGAGSVLEATAALSACRRGILPAAAGTGELDPEASVRLLAVSEAGAPRVAMDLSAAFGGATSALVVSPEAGLGQARTRRPVRVAARGERVDHLDLDALRSVVVVELRKLSRMDSASALAVAAAGSALARMEVPVGPRTAVIIGTETASVENDELFHRRLRERGVQAAEPRRFPPTSPNLPAGQCGIAFGLQGPAMGVGIDRGAALEALLVAHDLVAAGDADAAVVISVEHVETVVPALWTAAGWPVPVHGAMAVVLEAGDSDTGTLDRGAVQTARDRLSSSDEPSGAAQLLAHAVNG